jgi:hypothetical protein
MLVSLVCLFAVLLSGCSSGQKKSQANDIRKVADKITGYSLPAGYREEFALDVLGYQLVNLQGQTPNCHIYLAQATADIDIDLTALHNQNRAKDDRNPRGVRMVETRTVSLRGQEVSMLVSEGINSENQPYRQILALFEGRGGPAAVNLSAPIDVWDWEQVDEFLASFD